MDKQKGMNNMQQQNGSFSDTCGFANANGW
jgi:hypothetical protein